MSLTNLPMFLTQALVRHRDSLIETRQQQLHRLESSLDDLVTASLQRATDQLSTEIQQVEQQIQDHLDQLYRLEAKTRATCLYSRYRNTEGHVLKTSFTKIGNPRVCNILYFPALGAMRYNSMIQALHHRLLVQSTAKMVVVGAAMRKLLHLAYGVLKNKKSFDAAYVN